MSAQSIVSLDVGGTIFKTRLSTMLKYPGSKLVKMYNEGEKIKNLNYFFLDTDAEYFRVVLNFLRNGKIIKLEDENLYDGVLDLAKYLELDELVKLLEREYYGFSTVVFEDRGKEVKIARKFLTRVPDSHLAKFFLGEQGSQNPLSCWISKKGPNRYSINRGTEVSNQVLKFLKMPAMRNLEFNTENGGRQNSSEFRKELEFYGITAVHHYQNSGGNFISWNGNCHVN